MPEKKEHTTPDVDFSRVDAMTETEIQANALSDPDNPPLTDEQLDQMVRVYSPDQIRALRERFKLSRSAFAMRFHIPVRQLQEWEQGRKKPSASANTLFVVIDREPEAVARALTT